MLIKTGVVYRDTDADVDFVAVQHEYDDSQNMMTIHLVNVVNWIVVDTMHGRVMPGGEISCQDIPVDSYAVVAPTLQEYYKSGRRKKAAT